MTYDEYLALEGPSEVRHEFLNGQIYAMTGSTPEHSALMGAVIGLLFPQLRGTGCRGYGPSLRVRTPSGLATYPGMTIVCGATELDAEDREAVTNPTVIIEVMREDKFEHYKSMPSLRQYLLLSYPNRSIEVWTREGSDWSRAAFAEGQTAELFMGARLDVREVYDAAAEPSAT